MARSEDLLAAIELSAKTMYDQLKAGIKQTNTLEAIHHYVDMMEEYDVEVARIEAELKARKAFRDFLNTSLIPALLFSEHLKAVDIEDGRKVSYKEQVYVSLPKEDLVARAKALDFIKENGGGGLIKSQLIVESPTQQLIDELKGNFRVERIQDVHPASLKAFMSELLGIKADSVARLSSDEVPQELHLYIEAKTTVKGNGKEQNQ